MIQNWKLLSKLRTKQHHEHINILIKKSVIQNIVWLMDTFQAFSLLNIA